MSLMQIDDAVMGGGPKEYQKRLVQLGALVMAALECEERRR
jgi:hypothetical protein